MADTEPDRYCSPNYLLGAMATDDAPIRLSVKVTAGYRKALRDLDPESLHAWMQEAAASFLSRGWQQAALALLCQSSDQQAPIYERKAENYLSRASTRKEAAHG